MVSRARLEVRRSLASPMFVSALTFSTPLSDVGQVLFCSRPRLPPDRMEAANKVIYREGLIHLL